MSAADDHEARAEMSLSRSHGIDARDRPREALTYAAQAIAHALLALVHATRRA